MRVLISGAGIAGPTLAYFLAKAGGARITLVEKAPTQLPYGQNIDIQGSARKVIAKMGLLDEVRRNHTTEKGTQFIDPQGRPFAGLGLEEGKPPVSLTSEFEILRGDLAAVLWRATEGMVGVTYMFGTTVKAVLSSDEAGVRVELSDGAVHAFDLLVLADGQWSKLRKHCFPAERISVLDKNMYVAYFTVPRRPEDTAWWNVYHALGARIVTTRPDPHGTMRAMFSCMPRTPAQKTAWQDACRAERATQQALVRAEFADAGWQAQRLLDAMPQAPDFYFHPMQQIRMDKWFQGRVVCLGDTAWAPTPLTGMGTSLAITGAYVLAGELSKLGAGEHPARALEAFDTAFRPFVEQSQQIPPFVPGIAHPETAVGRWVFQAFVATLARIVAIPWVARKFDGGGPANEDDFLLPEYASFEDEKAG
ncbi:FAD/NAD(P)-binding domain-containing protein [Trematosphaeria pertusa]|uniref:FAD/NAD(P)-binding domain-containing protein n=1 Tax=Trematosphaeria pertusa TaxID=390896 RepID=A0A6A6ID68_9PLEO|nr:FAD/NAD(P)-binding domain-containing protein [Trematosphaeria pertusa]KAF2248525.1 FAD/NAD(P)-binding domain-containing protein [Trematosphaeria pertusa]